MSDDKKDVEVNIPDVSGGYIMYDPKDRYRRYSVIDDKGNKVAYGRSKNEALKEADRLNISNREISVEEVQRIKLSSDAALRDKR